MAVRGWVCANFARNKEMKAKMGIIRANQMQLKMSTMQKIYKGYSWFG
jgi:hypothetical protein